MKNVLAWVKTNWLIVTCCVVMVASLVTGWIVSGMWTRSQRDEFQAKVQQQMQQVQGARVNYAIPTLTPDEQAVTDSSPPNEVKTEWFRERIAARVQQAQELVEAAEAFNQGRDQEGSNRLPHEPLIPGLFPAPSDARVGRTRLLDFRDRVNGAGGEPPALQALLQRYGAGPPAPMSRVQTVLTDMQMREAESVRTETGSDPDAEQQARIKQMLTERRIQEYQRASRDISMYGVPAAFRMTPLDPAAEPTYTQCFAWQWDAWVVSDLLAAFALANTDADGPPIEVAGSVIKTIQSVEIEPINLEPVEPDDSGMTTEAPLPFGTITGRTDRNEDYDLRYARVVLVVASERLPEVFDALARTNYMSVLEFDLEQVDPWEHLRQGYYYGSDHVVLVTMRIETVWLRSWTGPLMPEQVRAALGVVVEPPAAGDDGSM